MTPIELGGMLYYRRGKRAKYIYRVLPEEFKTPRNKTVFPEKHQNKKLETFL